MIHLDKEFAKSEIMPTVYEQVGEELAKRLKAELGQRLHSLVLYGSVARGEAAKDSDIDVLIVTADKGLEKQVSSINDDLNFEKDYKVFLAPVYLSIDEFYRLVRLGSPFLSNVLEEGKILYDDGTYEGVRRKLFAQSR